jgi:hypothetical protein
MERRHFLKLALGAAAGTAALAASAQAAPLAPHPFAEDGLPAKEAARPAVTTAGEVENLKPEEVRWRHHWHRHWRRRHWGWHRRRWHRRHWRRRYW